MPHIGPMAEFGIRAIENLPPKMPVVKLRRVNVIGPV
jgi:hypothetical protein